MKKNLPLYANTTDQSQKQLNFSSCRLVALIVLFFGINVKADAQVSNYIFTQTSGTYTPGISGTSNTPADIFNVIWDDTTYRNYTLPFAFHYNGTNYPAGSGVGVDSDGWIAFSTSSPIPMTGTYAGGSFATVSDPTGIYLNGTGNNNGFAGFNADIEERPFTVISGTLSNGSNTITGVTSFANIQIGTRLHGTGITTGTVVAAFDAGSQTIIMTSPATASGLTSITPHSSVYAFERGTAPNRQFVIQWTQVKRNNLVLAENINFQIVLNEAGGLAQLQTIQVIYGTCTTSSTTTLNVQVGLRGAASSDFNARTTTTNWSATTAAFANTNTLSFSNTINPASGLTYTWSPCITSPGVAGAISGAGSVCEASTQTYTLAPVAGAGFYTWSYSGSGASFTAVTTAPSNIIAFAAGATSGTLSVTPGNLCGNGTASTLSITVNAKPTATISYPSASYCKSTAGSISITQTGTAGGTYSISGAGLTINLANGTITPSTSTAGTYTVTYTFSNGSCTNTSVTNVIIYDLPTASATATPAAICAGENSQLQASSGAISNNYTLQSLNYQVLQPEGLPTTLWNSFTDEAVSSAISIPFAFNYYGSAVSQLYVVANGYIQLQTNTGSSSNVVQTLPNAINPNSIIALAWQDLILDPSVNAGANIRYFVNGVAPNRVMVIEYNGISFYSLPSNTGNVTGQIRLYESDSHIEIAATTINDNGTSLSKTMGIENPTGTLAVTPTGRNKQIFNLGAAEAWGFYPPAGGSLTYLWTPSTFLSSTSISNPVANAMTATTNYNVLITNTATGCSNNATATVTVSAPLNGTYTVGAAGNYATLTAAISAYNSVCISGPVTFLLTDATYSAGETFPLIINRNTAASAVNTLTIKPATGVNATISGTVNSNALFRILGSYVTIDGSNNGSNSRNLTITNTGTSSARTILLGSTSTFALTNTTVKNCSILNGTPFSNAIVVSDAAVFNVAGYFNNITIQNNNIQKAFYGIYCNAVAGSGNGSGLLIESNDLNATGANAIQFTGLFIQGFDGVTVKGNRIGNFNGADDAADKGIWLSANVKNAVVTENIISNLNYTGTAGFGAQGIYANTGVNNANNRIANNMISNLSGDGDDYTNASVTLNNTSGILMSGTQSGFQIYHNSIYLGGTTGFTNTLNKNNAISTCIRIQGAGFADIRNNMMVNNLGRAASLGYGSIGLMASTNSSQFTVLNNNNYDINPTGSGVKAFGMISNTAQTSLAAWKTATGKDAASVNITPVFVSTNDLHLVPASNITLNDKGGAITAVVLNDIDNNTRNGLTPDIGCDEFVAPGTASWVGKTSTDWLDATNWESNVVPDGSTDVSITGGYTFMPEITNVQAVKGITMSAPGAAPLLTLTAGATLQINGNVTRTGGCIEASAATVEMNGTNAQTIPAGLFHDNKCLNLVIGNSSVAGVSLAGPVDIYRSLNFSASGLKLNTGDYLTFKSTATETAWLGNVTGKTITGNATVERFVPTGIAHGKSWQFLAVPISGSQTINQAWQDTATAPNQSRYSGYGTQITSNISPLPAMFDVYTPSGATMKTYNALTNNWDGVANTTTQAIQNKKGYMIFVRGDRTIITSSAPANTTVLRAKGKLYTATAGELPPVTTVPADKFESIGNPYASAIDFLSINKPSSAQVDDVFYVWDPLLPGTRGLGGFQTISSANGYYPIPGGTSNYCSCAPFTRIESGQAFLVHATGPGSGGNISFTENAKVSGSQLLYRQPSARFENRQFMRAFLFTGAGPEAKIADGNVAAFDADYTNSYTSDDALKVANIGENFGISSNNKMLTIEARSLPTGNDTVFYSLSNLRKQGYQFRFKATNMGNSTASAWLIDRFLQTETPVSLTDSTFIDFTITDNVASAAADRFYLVFRPTIVLPVTFTEIAASRKSVEEIVVTWKSENEINLVKYELERSGDGTSFNTLTSQLPHHNSGGTASYSVPDRKPLTGINFYRIKAISQNGTIQYSNIVRVNPVKSVPGLMVTPNPVQQKIMHIRTEQFEAGNYGLKLINQAGQVIFKTEFSINNGQSVRSIPLGNTPAGNYQLVVSGPDQTISSLKVLVL